MLLDPQLSEKFNKLVAFADRYSQISVAVSGGIDSMLLTYLLHRFSNSQITPVHAYSPAVPAAAFARVQFYAEEYHWPLKVIDANELDDENYRRNPVNRCYFCKSNLYERIFSTTKSVIFSGTNVDDLDDYRPGLTAAKERKVQHPYVEAGISKSDIYQLATAFKLTELQSLPAQPCLASRIETGIQVSKQDMRFIDNIENQTRAYFPNLQHIRCRITHQGVMIELDHLPEQKILNQFTTYITPTCRKKGYKLLGVRPYKKGAAFLTNNPHSMPAQVIAIKEVRA
ncbi:hypothetical protein C2869_06445 [Saccharobesus litoralis]|uniref:Uncharacterized protein n=2 Tax=Saccharobesus litoralis TaxID=2172099 RepID=A0A2S0VXU3_9ALTE|nr:hypothetical protein C2869_06445 [Saccharobesus litoralis]